MAAASGQAFFIEKGTPHGFRNVGDTPAAVLEIFVKDGTFGGEDPGRECNARCTPPNRERFQRYTRRVHSAGTLGGYTRRVHSLDSRSGFC